MATRGNKQKPAKRQTKVLGLRITEAERDLIMRVAAALEAPHQGGLRLTAQQVVKMAVAQLAYNLGVKSGRS